MFTVAELEDGEVGGFTLVLEGESEMGGVRDNDRFKGVTATAGEMGTRLLCKGAETVTVASGVVATAGAGACACAGA